MIENGERDAALPMKPSRGSLKIVKDSSDGRKDGFAIEVKSADGSYCRNLHYAKGWRDRGQRAARRRLYRNGSSQQSEPRLHHPDAATVEIKADETATVQLFNEKPDEPTPENPTTPGKPVPQTGDDNSIFRWGGLLAAP